MGRLIGDAIVGEEAIATMRERGGDWYAYQSHDMSSETLGDLQFLQCGKSRTFKEPPAQMPDTDRGIGWRYRPVGKVNLETGKIEENP